MAAAKVSITIDEDDLKWVRAQARRLRTSVSAVIADAVAGSRAHRAQAEYLAGAGPIDEDERRRAMRDLDR